MRAWLGFGLALCLGCSVGVGEGSVTGQFTAPSCDAAGAFDLRPNFFVAEPFESTLTIRVQRGGDFEQFSDGITVFVPDAADLSTRLGEPIEVSAEADGDVRMSLYMHKTCPNRANLVDQPLHLAGVEGAITFSAIYAPEVSEKELEVAATFENITFQDTSAPDERFGSASGSFRFLFNRGRPAQRFP